MPPNKVEQNLSGLLNLLPEEQEELLQRIDQPLQVETDPENGKLYIVCDYNRDGDSHRSPWSNNYYPTIDDGFFPNDKLRQLETEFNILFDTYRELYYDSGTSSVYLWELDNGFAASFLIKKGATGGKLVKEGSWDSIHVLEATEENEGNKANYKLTTTVMLYMGVDSEMVGTTNLAGSLTRQTEMTSVVDDDKTHVANMGRMVEDMETDMRNNLHDLYIAKTSQIVNAIRSPAETEAIGALSNKHVGTLNAAILNRGKPKEENEEEEASI